MEKNAHSSLVVSSMDNCYVPCSNWTPNVEQLSQVPLTQLTNGCGKLLSPGAKAPNYTPDEESDVAVSLCMNGPLKSDASSLCFHDSTSGNPVKMQQQSFVQDGMNAPMVPSSSAVTSISIPETTGNFTGVNVLQSPFIPRQVVKPHPETPGIAGSGKAKMQGRASMPDLAGKAPSQDGVPSISCGECNENLGFNAPGTELSLAIASVVDTGADNTEDSQSFASSFEGASQNSSVNNIDKSASRKDEMFLRLIQQVRELEVQLQERKAWAHQKALQAACKFSKDMAELRSLRLEHEEILCLKRDTQALEDNTMKRLTEMESALRKASAQVDKANASVRKLETENAELKAEMEAAKLSAAESNAKCQEVAKREKKSWKKIQAWEKQKAKMVEEIAKQKQNMIQAQDQLVNIKIQQHEMEMRWHLEEKAKEDALSLANAEKWAREQLELAAKRREETWRQKADADFQRHKDDIQRLESELEQLKLTAESSSLEFSTGMSVHTTDTNGLQFLKDTSSQLLQELAELQDSRDICRDRECVMCMSEESSVVFLPCAHQIVCTNCNDLHQKQGMRDCPSCRTVIQRRIQVLSAPTKH
ncbi:hypothetical protein KP509_02G052700 [Ceratopteris richardii]|uniref:RING-type domain-containing protein n=1 Tax=Ceratopteris richardii TaxID=49495 RepID=A0A8T2V5W5_CERRI|nr:hypothetical protein KP509_02G052700 [Ceratopteris richardii]